jgi:hypothetical protein
VFYARLHHFSLKTPVFATLRVADTGDFKKKVTLPFAI